MKEYLYGIEYRVEKGGWVLIDTAYSRKEARAKVKENKAWAIETEKYRIIQYIRGWGEVR